VQLGSGTTKSCVDLERRPCESGFEFPQDFIMMKSAEFAGLAAPIRIYESELIMHMMPDILPGLGNLFRKFERTFNDGDFPDLHPDGRSYRV